MSRLSLRATPRGMENVKIFATPEAYGLLSDAGKSKETLEAVKSVIEMVYKRHGTCPELFIEDCPLAISIVWGKIKKQDSYILIYKHNGNPTFHIMNPSMFYEKLETSIQISFT